ncbi:DNA repair protein RecN, partial [Leifsonia sp. SIMBA_070]
LESGSARLAELDDDGDRIERLAAERDTARADLDQAAGRLSAERRTAAARLGELATEELHALAMPNASLTVEVAEGPESSHGR